MKKNIDKRKKFSVAIIAGGKSIRFGEPKAITLLKNQRLIEYPLSIAKQLSMDIMLIFGAKSWMSSGDFQVIHDLIPECGPLGGIYTALTFCTTKWLVVIPCDMPHLNKDIYLTLLERRTSRCPVVAKSHLGLEPLVSVWHKSSLSFLNTNIEIKDYRMYSILCKLDAKEIFLPELMEKYQKQWFININYRSDLEKSGVEFINDKQKSTEIYNSVIV